LPFGYATGILNAGLLLALLGWIGRVCYERKLEWKRTPLDIPIAVFLGLALISSLFAPHQDASSLGYFWKLLRAILLFYAVIHSHLGTRWRHIILAFILAGGFSSALGLWYYANGAHLGTDFLFNSDTRFQIDLDEGDRIPEKVRRAFENKGVRLSPGATIASSKEYGDWLITDPLRNRRYAVRQRENHFNVYIVEARLAGTFKMPNDLGAYLVIVLPMTIGYFVVSWRTRQSWKFTAVLGGILCVMAANLALTLTRGAWVGVLVATIYVMLYFERRLLWGLLVIVLLSPFLMPRAVKDRFQTMWKRPAGFMSERPQWWKTSVQLIAKYPITGIGLGRFRYEYQLHGPPGMYHKPYHAHNIYLQVAVEQGVPSLIVFLWILFLLSRQLFVLRPLPPHKSKTLGTERDSKQPAGGHGGDDFWGTGLFIGGSGFLISALVYGLVDHILHQRPLLMFWFIHGIVFYNKSTNQ
ncbi:O-antigen ligase family protein, partial [Candidatus Poribacteria bacterium]|nr:O-antigen ligase family protein [Candidatus Poribacteria bacterium]